MLLQSGVAVEATLFPFLLPPQSSSLATSVTTTPATQVIFWLAGIEPFMELEVSLKNLPFSVPIGNLLGPINGLPFMVLIAEVLRQPIRQDYSVVLATTRETFLMGKTHGGLALYPAWSQESFGQLVAAVGILP